MVGPESRGIMQIPGREFVTHDEFSRFAKDVKESLTTIANSIDLLRTQQTNLATQQATTGKMSAKDLLGIGGFVIGSVGLATTLITVIGALAFNPLKESIEKHMALPGHPEALVEAADISGRVTALEEEGQKLHERLRKVESNRWTMTDHQSIVAPVLKDYLFFKGLLEERTSRLPKE